MIRNLSFKNPQIALFLRRLAWEQYIAEKPISVKDVVSEYVQTARLELGLKKYQERSTSGGADNFVQQRYGQDIQKEKDKLKLIDKGWAAEWRLLYLPSHGSVRYLSADPVIKEKSPSSSTYQRLLVSLRNGAIPTLDVFVGRGNELAKVCAKKRGVYFLGAMKGLYIGKTDEFETRWRFHGSKQSAWAVFITLAKNADFFTLDSLSAAEGLLISFWNEVCIMLNDNRGNDREPAFPYLQQALLFVEGASAAILWLARNRPTLIMLPFRNWSGMSDWPESYIAAPQS
ncbi:MAG: hypothetical protein WBD99_05685 [Thermodesulfobacteriota bacterium]